MESTDKQDEVQQAFSRFLRSHTARFLIVGFISIVLLIPLMQLGSLIKERKSRQEDVTDQLKTEWGGPLDYYGLVLEVPVTEITPVIRNDKGAVIEPAHLATHTAYVYPETSNDSIRSTVSKKYRGIFCTPIFTAQISGTARFNLAALRKRQSGTNIDWTKARIALVTNTDARFKSLSAVRFGGKSLPFEKQEQADGNHDLLLNTTAPFNLDSPGDVFDVTLNSTLNGSQAIHYQSLATQSTMQMTSNWSDPAFAGTSLPGTNSAKPNGKGFSRMWSNLEIGSGSSTIHVDALPIGARKFSDIRFIQLVDHYQLNERTIKYGLLVLTLTFAVFFLIQIVGKVNIHPLHYFMIGLALLLFYSLLLSLSEQLGFIPAYLIAATTIVVLIVWYARSILHSLKFAVMSGLSLSLLYAFLLVIVNLEIYALIVGSIGLLFVLASIMSVTRKLNFETT